MIIGAVLTKFLISVGFIAYAGSINSGIIAGDVEPNGTVGEKIVEMSFETFKQ